MHLRNSESWEWISTEKKHTVQDVVEWASRTDSWTVSARSTDGARPYPAGPTYYYYSGSTRADARNDLVVSFFHWIISLTDFSRHFIILLHSSAIRCFCEELYSERECDSVCWSDSLSMKHNYTLLRQLPNLERKFFQLIHCFRAIIETGQRSRVQRLHKCYECYLATSKNLLFLDLKNRLKELCFGVGADIQASRLAKYSILKLFVSSYFWFSIFSESISDDVITAISSKMPLLHNLIHRKAGYCWSITVFLATLDIVCPRGNAAVRKLSLSEIDGVRRDPPSSRSYRFSGTVRSRRRLLDIFASTKNQSSRTDLNLCNFSPVSSN